MLHDIFICHASEDKETFVRPLAEALCKENVDVWYDEFSLKLGDSLRRSIDKGLKLSRFGVVVLSPSFFLKRWTDYELDGLIDKEISRGEIVILPVWHDVSHDDVAEYSPSLAGRVAVSSNEGIAKVVKSITEVLRPQGSPLIAARDELIAWGLEPPVVTDPYWLEVVAASNRSPGTGTIIPEESIWGRWSFPLPPKDDNAEDWGFRLAMTAMQIEWTREADAVPISPISHPEVVLEFIQRMPGLKETCEEMPRLAAEYAPQLTIPGLGGFLEPIFEAQFASNVAKCAGTIGGEALTENKKSPECDEEWALRSPTFGGYKPSSIASSYFSGGMFGPRVSPFEEADHLFWLLSDDSNWLPQAIRMCLIEGQREWNVWEWTSRSRYDDGEEWSSKGSVWEAMHDAVEARTEFTWNQQTKNDLEHRIHKSTANLSLKTAPSEIARQFIDGAFVERYISKLVERINRSKSTDL
jgi:hypothetical protein